MFDALHIKPHTISPAFFLAPMVGITHSAFRRLVSLYGGYGCLFTEMLSGNILLQQQNVRSPYTTRRPEEGNVMYQIQVSGSEDLAALISMLQNLSIFGIDLNLGCPAPEVRKHKAGTSLFEDIDRLERTLDSIRNVWSGIFSVKCRLGIEQNEWKHELNKRFALFEKYNIQWIAVHPRFRSEKLRKRAQWHVLPYVSEVTSIPIVASGDITTVNHILDNQAYFSHVKGLMLGRIVAAQPWIFRTFADVLTKNTKNQQTSHTVTAHETSRIFNAATDQPVLQSPPSHPQEYAHVWATFFQFVNEDFTPEKAIGRIKKFTAYYSRNFFYGHHLFRCVQGSESLPQIYERAMQFFSTDPQVCSEVSVNGI